jgi:hypothetical protein
LFSAIVVFAPGASPSWFSRNDKNRVSFLEEHQNGIR